MLRGGRVEEKRLFRSSWLDERLKFRNLANARVVPNINAGCRLAYGNDTKPPEEHQAYRRIRKSLWCETVQMKWLPYTDRQQAALPPKMASRLLFIHLEITKEQLAPLILQLWCFSLSSMLHDNHGHDLMGVYVYLIKPLDVNT